MEAFWVDWVAMGVRWAHFVFGAAWIGTSFYFNWLNHSFRPPAQAPPGVTGEVWSVHGGEFFHVVKYKVAPEKLPETLHWFKWESYMTWITGVILLALVYYLGAESYLLDPSVSGIGAGAAVGLGVGSLVVGWFVYHGLCLSPLGKNPQVFAGLGLALVAAAAFGLSQVFSARGAYMHVGAILGTCMAGNVFWVIIPNQKIMVHAMLRGEAPDGSKGHQAAQRSLHNNYLTLPVLFVMISNHYPATYGSQWGWAVLAALFVIGALVKHYFNLKDKGRHEAWMLPVAAVLMMGLGFVLSPRQSAEDAVPVQFAQVSPIITQRCYPCHAATPTYPGMTAAPAGLMYDTPAQVKVQATRIHKALSTNFMPPGNVTQMSDEERALVLRWVLQGAPVE